MIEDRQKVRPPGLILHTSNRLEILAGHLAELLRAAPAPPLRSEVIIVQSQGMARWLQLQLATRLGLCACVRFPFPRAFAREAFRAFDPSLPEFSPTDPAPLTWRVWSLLPELQNEPGGDPIRRYLEDDADGRKRYQLAGRIARLFDDYAIFRPDLVLAWDTGSAVSPSGPMTEVTDWQARLWRKLRLTTAEAHPAELHARFAERIDHASHRPENLPSRLTLFGISALPPCYVSLFDRLGRWSSVHFFLLQPSPEYWGDIASAKAILRRGNASIDGPSASDLHRHEGNPLLASLGGQGRDFLNVLLTITEFNTRDEFVDPGSDSLLHCVQSDILNLRNAEAPQRGSADTRVAIRPEDDSIMVHSCHSPTRELEVLQDHMLRWLSLDPDLTPRDILVLTPHIETYAPLIEAVFAASSAGRRDGSANSNQPVIPFSVADRGSGSQSHILSAFVRILRLAGSRLGAGTVVELLETPAVRRRFGLTESDAFQAREWLRASGVRWGRDEVHRAALKLPALRQNTWADGLDRLLLGYAMSTDSHLLFQDILPCEGPEGRASDTLGRLLAFTNAVFATVGVLETPHSLADWVDVLRRVIDDFFVAAEGDEIELSLLREIVGELAEQAELAGTDERMSLAVILEHLEPALADDRLRGGFLTGRVTFAALKPMRSIPFKIICLLGLNDAAFPRADSRLGFDLMSVHPRLGDQSKREDDRYLFLETILSARQRLYLSYVGQSIRDNTPAPPSVLVSELLDYIDQAYRPSARKISSSPAPPPILPSTTFRTRSGRRVTVPDNQLDLNFLEFEPATNGPTPKELSSEEALPISKQLLVRHRLQAFSADYFAPGGRLFSYSENNFEGCRALNRPEPSGPFVGKPLPEPEEAWRNLDLDLLTDFFVNPARFFLTRRLGLRLPRVEGELVEREPMELDPLESYSIKTELLEHRMAGANLQELRPMFLASGRLPVGKLGALRYGELCELIDDFFERLTRYKPDERITTPELDLAIGPFRLSGRFSHVTTQAVLHYRAGPIGPKDRIRTWIRHLAWSCDIPSGAPRHSVLLGEPARASTSPGVQYRPMAARESRALLAELLEFYWRGLCEPLRFFPKTSLKFAEVDYYNADRGPNAWKDSLRKAQKEWESNRFKDGEMDDEYFKICFHDFNPLDGDFMALARQIGGPLIEHEAAATEGARRP